MTLHRIYIFLLDLYIIHSDTSTRVSSRCPTLVIRAVLYIFLAELSDVDQVLHAYEMRILAARRRFRYILYICSYRQCDVKRSILRTVIVIRLTQLRRVSGNFSRQSPLCKYQTIIPSSTDTLINDSDDRLCRDYRLNNSLVNARNDRRILRLFNYFYSPLASGT